MDDLWDKIAAVLISTPAHKQAAALIAALPTLVAPLVWKDTSKNDGWEVHQTGTAPNGTYYVIKAARYGDMLLCIQCGYFSDLKAAKAAANAHNAAAVVAAFTGDKT